MRPASSEPALLEVGTRQDWRDWLDANHDTSRGVRLAIGKKGNRVTGLSYEEAVLEALCFGWIDSTTRRLDEARYAVHFAPRRRGSIWARSNKKRVEELSAKGLMAPAGIAAVERARADGSWDLLRDVDDLVVPADLAAALEAVDGAGAGFAALSGSMRRMALYWILSAKRPETRERRISETVSAAAEGRPPRY